MSEWFCGQFPGAGFTYPRSVRSQAEIDGSGYVAGAMRVFAPGFLSFSRFARMAANFAADLERPPRRPIFARYVVTSEGTIQPTESRFHRQAVPRRQKSSPRIHLGCNVCSFGCSPSRIRCSTAASWSLTSPIGIAGNILCLSVPHGMKLRPVTTFRHLYLP